MRLFNRYQDRDLFFHHTLDKNPNPSDFFMHVHEQHELLYFVSGNASFLVETTAYPLIPNTLMIIRQMESHKIKILGDSPYERYAINFSPSLLEQIDPLGILCSPFINRPLGEKNIFYADEFSIPPKLFFEAMEVSNQSLEQQRTAILINLFPLLGQIHSIYSTKKHESFSSKKTLIMEITNYINEHLFEELSLEMLSNHFFISSSQLSHQFKQATGSPVWDYILSKRLVAVQNLIRNGHSVTKAYASCGFKDYSSFYRSYVKKFGISPKLDMRKNKD